MNTQRLWTGLMVALPVLMGSTWACSGVRADSKPATRLLPLKVVGTQVQNSRKERVRLRGVNAASLEWTSDGEGHILDTVKTAIQEWHVNIIRLPLSQDRWFGKAPEQKDDGKAYRDLVKQVVDLCASLDCYILLDLHWSDAGMWGQQIGQHVMPDENSRAFWKECAREYRNQPTVLFDLYNEPHDTTWDIWLNGGSVTERDRQRGTTNTYQAVGMQALLDTVRSTGAKNVVVAGGLDWAYDMSGFLEGKQLKDTRGNGVIYANHNYPIKGDTFDKWLAKMERATQQIPVIVSEFGGGGSRRNAGGSGDQWIRQVLQTLHDHQWDWIAWDMHPRAGPTLVSDFNYTPTANFGVYVKQELAGTLPAYTPPAEVAIPAQPQPSEPNGPAQPIDPKAAAETIDRAIKALGGEEALSKIKAASWKSKGTISFGGNDSEVKNVTIMSGLDHIRQEFSGEFGGNPVKGVTILAGDKGARKFGDNRMEMDKNAVTGQKRTVYLAVIPIILMPLKSADFKSVPVTAAIIDGKPATGIQVTGSDGKSFTLLFDKESGLLVRLVAKVPGFNGDEFNQETTYSDYKEMAGIKVATHIVSKRDGEKFLDTQITEFKILDSVDPKTFTDTE